jgi:pimeloyl-ACP methyl ester carboxylesterase
MTDSRPTTPLQALDVIGTQEADLAPGLRHLEIYTTSGLITVLWHGDPDLPGVVVACGGAMGGLLGPASGLYQRLGEQLPAMGIGVLRLSYRKPNDIDKCTLDLAAGVQIAVGHGATKVVTMGHSFGGAIAVRVGVGLPDLVAGVVTFATQSAGCEIAGGLKPRPFLLFHGERDEILPVEASAVVREIADWGELVVLPNDGHALAKSGPILEERLLEWLPAVFGSATE